MVLEVARYPEVSVVGPGLPPMVSGGRRQLFAVDSGTAYGHRLEMERNE